MGWLVQWLARGVQTPGPPEAARLRHMQTHRSAPCSILHQKQKSISKPKLTCHPCILHPKQNLELITKAAATTEGVATDGSKFGRCDGLEWACRGVLS